MKVIISYNKFNLENYQKTDVGGKSQDICQELTVTNTHTLKNSFYALESVS